MSLGAELQRSSGQKLKDVLAIMQKPVRSVMFELKVMEPAAFKFDYIATLHATLPNCWQGQHFGALMLLRNEMKIQDDFSVLTRNAAPGSISAVLRVV